MHFSNLKTFLMSVREFKQKHSNAFFEVADVPRNLWIGVKATVEDSITEWTLPISKWRLEASDALTANEQKIVEDFFKIRVKYNAAEQDYLNTLTASNHLSDSALGSNELEDALKKISEYADLLGNNDSSRKG